MSFKSTFTAAGSTCDNASNKVIAEYNALDQKEALDLVGVHYNVSRLMSNIDAAVIMMHAVAYACEDGYYYFVWANGDWVKGPEHNEPVHIITALADAIRAEDYIDDQQYIDRSSLATALMKQREERHALLNEQ